MLTIRSQPILTPWPQISAEACKGRSALFAKFLNNRSGSTAIEYALIAALVAVVLVPALLAVNKSLSHGYKSLADAVDAVGAATR